MSRMADKTSYGRLKVREKAEAVKKERRKKNPSLRKRDKIKKGDRCGAKKRNGELCTQPAGWGTTHKGFGNCRFHGGNMTGHVAHAAKNSAVLMGAPVDINPLDALIWCIKLTAGEIEFCTTQLEILEKDEWLEHTMVGKQVHVWAKERQKATERLAKFSKDALALGIAERAVRIAEQYGASLARYTKGLLDDLELTPEQQKRAPLVVRKHLALLEGGSPIKPEDRNLPAIPKRVAS